MERLLKALKKNGLKAQINNFSNLSLFSIFSNTLSIDLLIKSQLVNKLRSSGEHIFVSISNRFIIIACPKRYEYYITNIFKKHISRKTNNIAAIEISFEDNLENIFGLEVYIQSIFDSVHVQWYSAILDEKSNTYFVEEKYIFKIAEIMKEKFR